PIARRATPLNRLRAWRQKFKEFERKCRFVDCGWLSDLVRRGLVGRVELRHTKNAQPVPARCFDNGVVNPATDDAQLVGAERLRPRANRIRVVEPKSQRAVEHEIDFVKGAVEMRPRRLDVKCDGNTQRWVSAAAQDFTDLTAPRGLLDLMN